MFDVYKPCVCAFGCSLPDHYTLRRLLARDTGLPSAAPLLKSYAKVETMTIADLSSFIVSAASQVY